MGTLVRGKYQTEKAKSWFVMAANLGSIEAMYELGLIANKENFSLLAQDWWYQAATHKHLPSINKLAELTYRKGFRELSLQWSSFGRNTQAEIPGKLTPAKPSQNDDPTPDSATNNASNRRKPILRLIRAPKDAEDVAAEWKRYMGFIDATSTPVGPDCGLDVISTEAVAQVKMEGVPTSRPILQALHGVAQAEDKRGLFFSLNGYTKEAQVWGDSVGMPLFQFDLQGEPRPVNQFARRLLEV